MVDVDFFGNFDLASLAIWLFWFFFAGLVYYIQRENMREGYPLQTDDGEESSSTSTWSLPQDKTFKLPHGRGEVTVPSGQRPDRADLALERSAAGGGFPFIPTGDPLKDGVGPASWTNREDAPELDAHGHAKIVPMTTHEDFFVSAGRDPRGMKVRAKDGKDVGTVTDMWIDPSEHMVRYLQYDLDAEFGGGTKLVPIGLARVQARHVKISSLASPHFADVPTLASDKQITKLEEEKVSAYYAGGTLYS